MSGHTSETTTKGCKIKPELRNKDNLQINDYPKGTLLCNHRCVQPESPLGSTSGMGVALSLNETDWERFFPSGTWFTDTELLLGAALICLSILTLSVKSEEPMKGLIGDVGEVLNDTTEGGEVKEAGASTVIVRSCEVRFDAWRVKTWQIEHKISIQDV